MPEDKIEIEFCGKDKKPLIFIYKIKGFFFYFRN